MSQPCTRKLRPVALAAVFMKLPESCVIEQHTDRLLKGVEPTNLELGTTRMGRMLMSYCQLTWETLTVELFDQRAWKWPGVLARSLLRFARHNGNPATRGSGSDATMDGLLTARREADGRVQGPCK